MMLVSFFVYQPFCAQGAYRELFISPMMIFYTAHVKQFVHIGNVKSTTLDISVGVPQGSILRPLLFLLYVNDVQYANDLLHPIIFADDTNLFTTAKKIY